MGNSLTMEVFESGNKLMEVSSGNFFSIPTSVGNVFEQLTSGGIFEDDGHNLVCLSVLLNIINTP